MGNCGSRSKVTGALERVVVYSMTSELGNAGREQKVLERVKYPSLYQVNTRVWLTQLSRELGRRATLDDLPDFELDHMGAKGFDWVWFLSVWQTGPAAQKVSRSNPEWLEEFAETLSDLSDDDIEGSGFAITDYVVHQNLGGDAALARLRKRLHARGLRLMLDFVPNHTALDHRWVEEHPEYYLAATEQQLAEQPQNYCRVTRKGGDLILAYGRDPYFAGWPDTLQLNYSNPGTQEAMLGALLKIEGQGDGVRCDMAMLLLPEVFERTWGRSSEPFWPKAIECIRRQYPDFRLMAEVYWDLEWSLQQQGFDYTYDKRLYDRLREGKATSVRQHLMAGLDYQNRMARFLENHDEARAAASFPLEQHRAAAAISFLSPGLRFFHQGQFEGRVKRISPHLVRAPKEPINQELNHFYNALLSVLRRRVVREGNWQLVDCEPAWEGNWTSACFIAFAWEDAEGSRLIAAVNYAPNQSQCYVRLRFADLGGAQWRLEDLLGEAVYERDGDDLATRGLYLDEGAWNVSVFLLSKRELSVRGRRHA